MKAYSFKKPMLPSDTSLLDDPSPVVRLLEVRVGEAEEHLLDGSLPEVVCDVAHGVGPQHADVVVVLVARLDSESCNLLADEVHYLVSDLDAQTELVGKVGGQCN